MAEGYKSYRIRTKVGQDAPNVVNVHLDQTYDEFQILSLKIDQVNSYNLYQSDKGVVVGRVLANGGFGVPNAKVSIFIPTDDTMGLKKHILYPYSSVNDANNDRVRYNLLPDYVDEACHQNVGTFPNKRLVLDNDDIIEIFDKFWKYTTVTNQAGDYMLYGIPTGNQTLHMDVDLSDIGLLSQRPRDMVYKGYNINQFESPNKFKQDTNLNSLAQIKSQDIGVYVYPFWGDTTDNGDNIAITRCDIQIDYKFEPTCIFIGSIITDTGSNAIGKNCAGTDNVGKMSDLVAGEGSIEMIRKTLDNKVEEFQIKGNRVIDGDGVWCYQIPMNLDYVTTDEFGNMVPTDNPDKGIPTRTRVRFRISLDDAPSDNTARKRCRYLVPNNPRIDAERFPVFTADEAHEPDYEFGTNTREESYCDLFWNKVYSVKNYIPRIQKNTKITNRKHTGIKLINHYGDNNPMPYNNLSIKLSFTYRFICVLTKIFIKLVGFLNNIITLLGMIPCQLASFFRKIASLFNAMRIRIRAFGKTLINICLGCPIGALFEGIAKIFDLMTPSCIAISSEFCSGDVTHAYTFYPGCGMFLGLTFGLLKCVWNKTKENHNKGMINGEVAEEDRTTAINKSAELYNCVESQLAEDNDATSFNFQNDWINGTLYSPLWFRKITPKRSFLFGLFKRRAKDEWCSADHVYNGLVRIFQPCAVWRDGSKNYTKHDGRKDDAHYMNSNVTKQCGDSCHEKKTVVGLNTGLIRTKETMLGQTVYYYKPVEYEANNNSISKEYYYDKNGNRQNVNGSLKLLFATDIILLGSLNDCDLNGVPQFFKSLESTTYKLPSNMLFTDNVIEQHINEDGTITNDFDQVSTSEMTGNDWGNSNDDICGEPDGGLFYSIGCSTIEMQPKSCINLSRICEFGVSLDETKQIPTLSDVENGGDNAFETLVPDGYISKDELYNDNERSMFATLNGNELLTKLNTENGLKEYDFRHIYTDNFDASLFDIMTARQRRCNGYTYQYNYNLEEFSPGYYDFRMGKKPYFYDNEHHTLPRYENSFYFYFGLKVGKTALDKFNSQFFAECYNPEDAVSPIGIETKANTWCSDSKSESRDGFVKIDLTQVALPCDILIKSNNSDIEFELKDIDDEKIIISNTTAEGYINKCDGSVCALENGYYTMTVTDNDGEIMSIDFELSAKYLRYNVIETNFKQPDNILLSSHDDSRIEIAKDKVNVGIKVDATHDYTYTRQIGGTIAIYNIVDGLKGEELDDYRIKIESVNDIDGFGGKFTLTIDKSNSSNDYWLNSPSKDPYIIGVPKGDEKYKITVVELCDGSESNNKFVQTVTIKDSTPYKLYINDVIDYDVIKTWTTGFTLKDDASANSNRVTINSFEPSKLSPNWFKISEKDGNIYDWKQLITYKRLLEKINKAIKSGKTTDSFPSGITEKSGNLTDVEINTLKSSVVYPENYTGDDKTERDSIIEACDELITLKDEFISSMKEAFWLTCPEEYKTITFRATTDDMPVAFFIAHRSEKASDDGDENVLEFDEGGKKLYYSFNESDRIEDIMIPSLTSKDSERFGGDTTNTGYPNISLAIDNHSGFKKENSKKYAFFVGVINSSSQTSDETPNGETIPIDVKNNPYTSKLFGFHVLDKIFNINYIAWASMIGLPFYKVDVDKADSDITRRRGKFIISNGLFAGKIYNGVANSSHEFSTAQVGTFKMDIDTTNGEDDMPTKRFIQACSNPLPLANFSNYSVEAKTGYEQQYLPVLPVSSTLNLEDYSNCQLSEEIYGGLSIELEEESINDLIDSSNSILSVAYSNGPGDEVVFFAYELGGNPLNYPINHANLAGVFTDIISPTDKYQHNGDGNKIFAFNTDKLVLIQTATNDLKTELVNKNGVDKSVCEFFEIDDNASYNSKSIGTSGEFVNSGGRIKGEYFIVARTNNECRALSSVYAFVDVCGGMELTSISSKVEDGTEEIETEIPAIDEDGNPIVDEDGNPSTTTETSTVMKYKTVTENKIGFRITNVDDLFYFKNFSYTLEVVNCEIDSLHKVSGIGMLPAGNSSFLYIDVDDITYELAKNYLKNPLQRRTLANKVEMIATDVTGLRHRFRPKCPDSSNPNIPSDEVKRFMIVFDLNDDGYWIKDETTGETDNASKYEYYENGDSYTLPLANDDVKTLLGWSENKFAKRGDADIESVGTVKTASEPDIWYAIWYQVANVVFNPDATGGGYWEDDTTDIEKISVAVDEDNKAICPKVLNNTDSDKSFIKWMCDDPTVIIDEETGEVTSDHDCEVYPQWGNKFTVRWMDSEDDDEPVNITFKVSTNNGKWYPDDSVSDYTMAVSKNSTVTCDRIAISTQPLIYGFAGWSSNSSATSGSSTVEVGETDMTVYAIFKTKECQIAIKDVSTGTDNITLEVESQSGAGGTHWEYTGFTEGHQNMIGGSGTLECNGITDSSIIRLYIADDIFFKLNGNNHFADLYKNRSWHIDEYNEKLQEYNICYTVE